MSWIRSVAAGRIHQAVSGVIYGGGLSSIKGHARQQVAEPGLR